MQNYTCTYTRAENFVLGSVEKKSNPFFGELDYYPGGMQMPSRNAGEDYVAGFQGQLHDDEITNSQSIYAFEYRMSDSRLVRFWSVDPLSAKYPYYSTYSFSGNRLIDAVELEGLEPNVNHRELDVATAKYYGGATKNSVKGSFENSKALRALYHKQYLDYLGSKEFQDYRYSQQSGKVEPVPIEDFVMAGQLVKGVFTLSRTLMTKGVTTTTTAAVNTAETFVAKSADDIATSTGRKINIYGEGEAAGFDDFAVNADFATGGNGVTRPLTSTLSNGSASDIVVNNAPLYQAELSEITRLSTSGSTITYSAPAGSKFFQSLSSHLSDKANLVSTVTSNVTSQGASVEMQTVVYQIK